MITPFISYILGCFTYSFCNDFVMKHRRTTANDNEHISQWKLLTLGTCLLFSLLENYTFASQYFSLQGTIFEQVGNECDVDPALLYSIALVESATHAPDKSGFIQPYPWTLRATTSFYGTTRDEAEKELKRLLKTHRSVDVGLMQINTKWHGHRVDSALSLLDPLTNVRVGAQILSEQIESSKDAELAIGRYHSSDPVRARWYAQHVLRVYTHIKQKEKK